MFNKYLLRLIIKYLMPVFICMLSFNSNAASYYWPVIYHTDMQFSRVDYTGKTLLKGNIYWRSIFLDDSFGDGLISNIEYYGFGFKYRSPAQLFTSIDHAPGIDCQVIQPYMSIAKCMAYFQEKFGTSGVFEAEIAQSAHLCIMPGVGPSFTPDGYGPEHYCYKVPPLDEYCRIINNEIVLDFGVVHSKEKDIVKAQAALNVECSSNSIKYKLKTNYKNDAVLLSNGIDANIMINGRPVSSQPINGIAGVDTLMLEGTLSGEPNQSGAFSGTAIIYIAYQ